MDNSPFESIESAQQFVQLLIESVADSRKDVEADIAEAGKNNTNGRRDKLLLVAHQLNMLSNHLAKTSHILNDLKSLQHVLGVEQNPTPKPEPNRAAVISDSIADSIDW